MISFQTAIFPLLFGSFLIIIGNTGFPCMLRLVIWILAKLVPKGTAIWEELRFLLDHPRRCFTLLFPSKATWWLFWILVLLNGLDLIFFIILDVSSFRRLTVSSSAALTSYSVARRYSDLSYSWYSRLMWLVPSCINQDCRVRRCQPRTAAPRYPGLVPRHDVYLYISHCHICASNKCLRGKEFGNLGRRQRR